MRRFGIPIYVNNPDIKERANFIRSLLLPCVIKKEDIYTLAANTDLCSYVELQQMIGTAIQAVDEKKIMHTCCWNSNNESCNLIPMTHFFSAE